MCAFADISKFQRLGYGGGYYDRTLAGSDRAIEYRWGAYEGQKTDSLVVGPYDEPLEAVLTPHGWLIRPD